MIILTDTKKKKISEPKSLRDIKVTHFTVRSEDPVRLYSYIISNALLQNRISAKSLVLQHDPIAPVSHRNTGPTMPQKRTKRLNHSTFDKKPSNPSQLCSIMPPCVGMNYSNFAGVKVSDVAEIVIGREFPHYECVEAQFSH